MDTQNESNIDLRKSLLAISTTAAEQTSGALAKLSGREVQVEIFKVTIEKPEQIQKSFYPEEQVVGIYCRVTGDLLGAALLILPEKDALILCDVLLHREVGTTQTFSALDDSALQEVGNILTGNYLTILANQMEVRLIESPPGFTRNMFAAILQQVITDISQKVETAAAIEVDFVIEPVVLRGVLLLFFEWERFAKHLQGAAQK